MLLSRLPSLWKLKWDNSFKETLWRAQAQGVWGAGGHDLCLAGACPCGWEPSQAARQDAKEIGAPACRLHALWECIIAKAVVSELVDALRLPVGVGLHCAHLWLVKSPFPSIKQPVWEVVCLAALSAMLTGRKYMWKLHFELSAIDVRHHPGGSLTQRASTVAASTFWANLQDFVQLHNLPGKWPGGTNLPVSHPFIAAQPGQRGLQRQEVHAIRVNLPEGRR